tara:strand:- start:1066 stop:3228 length:2163 start_codon:yes stop_codon:yes gene_type:complete
MIVTQFPHIKKSTEGKNRELSDVLKDIKSGAWADIISHYRSTKDKKDKESLPYITPSGIFKHRKSDSLVQHSGLICIDFDNLSDLQSAKDKLCSDPFTFSVFASAGGEGLACFVKIEPDKHDEAFELLSYYYNDKYGLKPDPSCSDVSRARFVSHDPELCLFENSQIFNEKRVSKASGRGIDSIISTVSEKLINAAKGYKHSERLKQSRLLGGFVGSGYISYEEAREVIVSSVRASGTPDMTKAIKTIEDGLKYGMESPLELNSSNNSYDHQIIDTSAKQIYKLARRDNQSGKRLTDEYFHEVCSEYYVTRNRVESIYKTIYQEFEDEHDIDNAPRIRKIEHFIKQAYDFKRNEITQRSEMRKLSVDKYEPINADTIWRHCQHKWTTGQAPGHDLIKSLLRSDFVKSYNPFFDYFNGLDRWDETTDYISELSAHITVEDQVFFQTQFKKALVRCIACALYGIENRIVFVLVGEKQSTGKSTFIRFLNPFGHQYYTEAPMRDNKDTYIRMSENFIYNIEELASMSHMDVNRLKAIISTVTVKERKAYAADEIEQPRRCNFFASTNKTEFLTDTENTRWLCFNVKEVDWGYSDSIDVHKVWAQAFHLYKSKFHYILTTEEQQMRDDKNKHFEVQTTENDLLRLWFKPCDPDHIEAEFLSSTEILQKIQIEAPSLRMTSRGIGRALTSIGFNSVRRRVNGKVQRGYWVINEKQKYDDEGVIPF